MIIDLLSDLHGEFPTLEGGDMLIIAGDVSRNHKLKCVLQFFEWLEVQNYRKKVLIAGNHDVLFDHYPTSQINFCDYLMDSGTEFEGLKIWGSPWTKWFAGMNENCQAFTKMHEEDLAERWALIPDDTNILVTHCPPYGMMDGVGIERTGSVSLTKWQCDNVRNLKLHVWGHIHEGYGIVDWNKPGEPRRVPVFVNAAHMNRDYDPVNPPIRVIL